MLGSRGGTNMYTTPIQPKNSSTLRHYELPVPSIYDANRVGDFFTPKYEDIMKEANDWRNQNKIAPRRTDRHSVALTIIDQQKTFCLNDGELSVAPASIDDTVRICEFLYRNMRVVSDLILTLDTHYLFQIFHPLFWIDHEGKHPPGFTVVLPGDIGKRIFVNPEMAYLILGDMKFLPWLQSYALHYAEELTRTGKPPLVIWPVHGRLGSPGHAIVPSLQVAADFHSVARWSRTQYRLKGDLPLSEYYSPFGTEVTKAHDGVVVGEESDKAIEDLLKYELLIIAGEAESHCVRAAIYDILRKIKQQDPALAKRIYILGDCTSSVPGFEQQGKEAIEEFQRAGMHLVSSTTPMEDWPDVNPEIFQL
jgi:nicotinamidase-related amidase